MIPEIGLLRLSQIIGNPKADPPIPAIFPVSRSTLWAMVREKRFPQPVHLSRRCVAWKVEDVRKLIEALK